MTLIAPPTEVESPPVPMAAAAVKSWVWASHSDRYTIVILGELETGVFHCNTLDFHLRGTIVGFTQFQVTAVVHLIPELNFIAVLLRFFHIVLRIAALVHSPQSGYLP